MASNINNIKLTYLKINAKAAAARAILSYTKTPFENITLTLPEFNELKKKTTPGYFEYNQVPVLEINNKRLTQSHAINSYLSKIFKIDGDNDFEGAEILSIFSSYEDFWPKFRPIVFQLNDLEKSNIKQIKTDFFNSHAKSYLEIYERRFNKNNTGYLVGKRLSGADIWISVILFNIFKHPMRIEEYEHLLITNAPNLNKHVDSIVKKELKSYFDKTNKNGFIYDSVI